MGEMFSWYIDNNRYLTEEYVKTILDYYQEAKNRNIEITQVVTEKNPNVGNKSSIFTAARDFGIINLENDLSDSTILYVSKFYDYESYVIDLISKRNVSKSKPIPMKPLVVISIVFDIMNRLEISQTERFLTTDECYCYLSVLDSYSEITEALVKEMVETRVYDKSNVPQKRITAMSNAVCLSEIFSALADSNLFEFGPLKTIIRPVNRYIELLSFIAQEGRNISVAPFCSGRDNSQLYEYLCDISTGIKEIIPELEIQNNPNPNKTMQLYEYLFGISKHDFNWRDYFQKDCFGLYRIFYPIRRIVFAKIYIKNRILAERLCDYSIQAIPYTEYFEGGHLMIKEPFELGHTDIDNLKEDAKLDSVIAKGGINKIYYGAPGCGKSYHVQKLLADVPVNEENIIRATFHPEYANCDFIGQILPTITEKCDENTGETKELVKYIFNPGPLTLALRRAYNTSNMVYLIIEEINRGNAAAIFGDMFQLLDRVRDNSKPNYSASEYPVSNPNMQKYLIDSISNETIKAELQNGIYIPSNLTIYATMNSSDQNVFTLDTAFKRRWSFEQISNDISKDADHEYKTWYVPGTTVTWADFLTKLNSQILEYKLQNQTNEDKRLGKYFVTKECLADPANIPGDVSEIAQNFAYKVLEYVWNDVCKIGREEWFDTDSYKTLEDLIDAFVNPKEGETPLSVFQNITF